MIVGITGGIGSGKSKVASLLGEILECTVLNADDLCRDLLEKGGQGYLQFVQSGGQRFLDVHGEIDRSKLREELFSDRILREHLESILHPLVLEKIRSCAKEAPDSLVIAEVPLLFESGWQDEFDIIIAVSSPEEKIIERVIKRDQASHKEVSKIIATQMDSAEKNRLADYVIENSAGWQETEQQVVELVDKLQKKLRGT